MLLVPGMVSIGAFFLLPLSFVLWESVYTQGEGLTLHQYFAYIADSKFHTIFLRTLKFGFAVTGLSAILCYPASYAISRAGKTEKISPYVGW